MGFTDVAASDILHSSREFTSVSCGVLGPSFTKHDQLLPHVISDSGFPGGHNSDAFWTDSRITW